VPQVSEDLDTERERFADLKRTYNAAVARFEEAQQRGVQEVVSAAEAGLRSSLRTVQERMRSMATEQSSMQRALSEKQERVELLSDSILQLQLSLVDEEASNSRLQEEVAHLRQQLALSISMPAPRSFQEGDDAQLQLLRLRQEKQELQERVRELQRHHDTNAQWEEQLKQLECMQQETQQETERMLGQVRRALCCCSTRAAHTRCSGKRTHPALAVAAGAGAAVLVSRAAHSAFYSKHVAFSVPWLLLAAVI
jgi:threonyl-tRNA synthetase